MNEGIPTPPPDYDSGQAAMDAAWQAQNASRTEGVITDQSRQTVSREHSTVSTAAISSLIDGESPEGWMIQAKCRGADPSVFFLTDGTGVERAQRVCDSCPVKVECLEYALKNHIEHGIWGGASERERRRILRRRRQLSGS